MIFVIGLLLGGFFGYLTGWALGFDRGRTAPVMLEDDEDDYFVDSVEWGEGDWLGDEEC